MYAIRSYYGVFKIIIIADNEPMTIIRIFGIHGTDSISAFYTTLATMVQLFGEDEGFEFMKALHKNINQYTKSGSAPVKAAARGENTIGIVFIRITSYNVCYTKLLRITRSNLSSSAKTTSSNRPW